MEFNLHFHMKTHFLLLLLCPYPYSLPPLHYHLHHHLHCQPHRRWPHPLLCTLPISNLDQPPVILLEYHHHHSIRSIHSIHLIRGVQIQSTVRHDIHFLLILIALFLKKLVWIDCVEDLAIPEKNESNLIKKNLQQLTFPIFGDENGFAEELQSPMPIMSTNENPQTILLKDFVGDDHKWKEWWHWW